MWWHSKTLKVTDASQYLAEVINRTYKRKKGGETSLCQVFLFFFLQCVEKQPEIKTNKMPFNNTGPHKDPEISPNHLGYCTLGSEWQEEARCLPLAWNYFFLKLGGRQSCTECHIYWPLKRPVACMLSFNPPDFKRAILSESGALSELAGYVLRLCSPFVWAYIRTAPVFISTCSYPSNRQE